MNKKARLAVRIANLTSSRREHPWWCGCQRCDATEEALGRLCAEYDGLPESPEAERRPLPTRRRGITEGLRQGAQKIYVRTGNYPDDTPGEVWIDMHREGTFLRGFASCFATAVSLGLQYGIPLAVFVNKFVHTRFGTASGPVAERPDLGEPTSPVDLIFRALARQYGIPFPDEPPKL